MLNSTKFNNYGMPPGWLPAGKTKRGRVVRWRKGRLFVERINSNWFWYGSLRTKYMNENGAFKNHVAAAVAAELACPDLAADEDGLTEDEEMRYGNGY